MVGVDAELLTGARLLASGTWRASHEAFETAWRRSDGEGRDLLQALAQLAAALLKWSEGHLEPAATILGRVRGRLEGLPSHVSRVDVETLESTAQAPTLEFNDLGAARIALAGSLAADRYADNRATGSFILVDDATHQTVAGGMISEVLRG